MRKVIFTVMFFTSLGLFIIHPLHIYEKGGHPGSGQRLPVSEHGFG